MDIDRLRIEENKNKGSRRSFSGTAMLITGVLCAVAGFLAGHFLSPGRKNDAVKVSTALIGAALSDAKSFTAGGWIEAATPQYPIIISSRISQRLEKILVKQGDDVKPGQLLASLYDVDAKSKLDIAKARLKEAEEKAALAKTNFERTQKLEPGTISQEETDRLETEFKATAQVVMSARAEADMAERELSYCSITAPEGETSMKILAVYRSTGDWISPEKSALFSIYDPSNINVRVDVSQANIGYVKAGSRVIIKTDANARKEYHGAVIRIDPLAELSKNTVSVRIKIEDPDEMLFPEMVAHVSFLQEQASSTKKEIMIPQEAVIKESSGAYVYIVEYGVAKKQKITTGQSSGNAVTVSDGLKSGQRIIVSGLNSIQEGTKVNTNE